MDRCAGVTPGYWVRNLVGFTPIKKQDARGLGDQLIFRRDFFYENAIPWEDEAVAARLLLRGSTSAWGMTVQVV
jgi:hypothetical protein